jgi:cation diffusion facilitator family transporter
VTARTAALSVGVAILLIAMKAGAYAATASVSMLATLADSALDLAASVMTFLAVRYAAAPPDREHRFGHGKAEAFAGLIQAGLVAVSGAFILWEAVRHVRTPHAIEGGIAGVAVMAASIAVTALLIWAQTRALKETGSIATRGDRAHYMSDLASNVAAMAGVVAAAFFGLTWIDALIGAAIALWLGWGAAHIARDAADHLLDRELPETDRERIRVLAQADGRIRDVHDLRTRASGIYMHIQFHASLDPALALTDAHAIVVAAEDRIRSAYPQADVIIHADPAGAAEPHGHEDFEPAQQARSA